MIALSTSQGHHVVQAFVPTGKHIGMYDIAAGTLVKTLKGHYSAVLCCAMHPHETVWWVCMHAS